MAFTNLYVQSGGNDMNAGSSTANSADVTSTNGSWDITADTFIATAATPFSTVTAADWVSIYVDGVTTGAVYVAQVVSINNGGLSVTLSTTAKYGTKPSASATGRSAKVNGAWASELPFASGGLGGTTIPAATKINIKQATYTIVASRTISLAGATTKPLWFSGYNATPGDLDTDTTNALSKPVLACNAAVTFTTSGANHIWSGLSITGNVSSFIWNYTGANGQISRCRVENTSSNAAAYTVALNAVGLAVHFSWFKAPTTATTTGALAFFAGSITCLGVVSEGGGLAGFNVGSQIGVVLRSCVAFNNTGSGILFSTGGGLIDYCTIYNSTVDGIKWTGAPASGSITAVSSCLFATCGGWGINNASGTNTGNVRRMCNDYYSCASGNETGFGDHPAFFGKTDSSSPVTGSADMTPASNANARANGFPGIFENQGYSSYPDIGAVRHVDPSAGGINRSALPSGLSSLG